MFKPAKIAYICKLKRATLKGQMGFHPQCGSVSEMLNPLSLTKNN